MPDFSVSREVGVCTQPNYNTDPTLREKVLNIKVKEKNIFLQSKKLFLGPPLLWVFGVHFFWKSG